MPAPSLYDSVTLTQAIASPKLNTAPQWLLDTFAPNSKDIFGEYVEFAREPVRNGIAKMVYRGMTGSPVQKAGAASVIFRLPIWKETMRITAVELFNNYGLTNFRDTQAGDRSQQLSKVLNDCLVELKNRSLRLQEYLFAKFFTGNWSYTNPDTPKAHYELSLGSEFTPFTGTYSPDVSGGTTGWDIATGNPMDQYEAYAKIISANSNQILTNVVLGSNAASAFRSNVNVKADFNRLNWRVGQLTPDVNSNSISTSYGNVTTDQYVATYQDTAGAQQYYLHPDYALFIGGKTGIRAYGIPDHVDGMNQPGYRVDQWNEVDGSAKNIQAQCAMLPFIPEIGSWVYAKVV